MTRPRIPRTQGERLDALRAHLRLLHDYCERAFQGGDDAMLGEIAGKIRVLAIRARRNHPLLIDLMDELGERIELTFEHPRKTESLTLSEYMEGIAVMIRTPSSGLVTLSNREFVLLWAQQQGASHEDKSLDEALHTVMRTGIKVGGVPAHARTLGVIAQTVLVAGDTFLQQISKEQ